MTKTEIKLEKRMPSATSTWILSTNNGNTTSHGVLRLADFLHGLGVAVPYTGSGTPLDSMLTVYQYDQAGRRVASADLVGADSYLTLSQYDETQFRPRHVQDGNAARHAVGSGAHRSLDDYL